MRKILIEYYNIISYTIIGIIFGTTFFLLVLNLYHYNDINELYKKQDSDYTIIEEFKTKFNNIDSNINSVSLNSMNPNYNNLLNIQSRLTVCKEKINTLEFDKLFSGDTISIKNVYDLQQYYKMDIANDCLVKELYGLIENSSMYNITSYKELVPFLENNLNQLRVSTDYVEKIMKNNSSYSFTSNSTKNNIYDQVKDSYYEIVNNYVNVIDFIYDLSVWYKNVAGDNV